MERRALRLEKIRLAILASGSGSTGEVLFDKAVVVITNNQDAHVIERAEKHGISCKVRMRKDYQTEGKNDPVKYGDELINIFREYEVNFISQNGWSILTPANVVREFEGRIVNAHPAPLDIGHPDFGGQGMHGLAVHAAVLNFAREISRPFKTEVTLHQVSEKYDEGGVLAFSEVEILPDDTPQKLQDRIKEVEKKQNIDFWNRVKEFGHLPPVIARPSRLIFPNEVDILKKAKAGAITAFPHG